MTRTPLILLLLVLASGSNVHCRRYNVGDLHCWGPPSSSNPDVYSSWSKTHRFKIGDSLMFLYPPSEDSVVQLSEEAFKACDVSAPVLKMNDGNSLFNLTSTGALYFASGESGRCGKHQRFVVDVLFANGSASAAEPPASSASFPMVFGPSGPLSNSAARAPMAVGSQIVGLVMTAVVLVCFWN